MTITDPYSRAVPENEKISRADAAALLAVSLQTLDAYARSGRLRRIRNPVTRRVHFVLSEVQELRREREEGEE